MADAAGDTLHADLEAMTKGERGRAGSVRALACDSMQLKDYDEFSIEKLQDSELAAEYLSVALEDGSIDEFLFALRNVAEAHGGIGTLSEITDLNRQNMYKMLSDEGNPTLASLLSVLNALGISVKFTVDEREAA